MELVARHVDGCHFVICNGDALRVIVGVEFAVYGQAGVGGGSADQVHNDAVANQRLGPPVHADEREQPVLDLVPLAGARREVMHTDLDAEFVGQAL